MPIDVCFFDVCCEDAMPEHIIVATRKWLADIYYFSGYRDRSDGWDQLWTEDLFQACRFNSEEAAVEMMLLAEASDTSDLASMETCPWVEIPNRAWR
jgi:hypothetical protein